MAKKNTLSISKHMAKEVSVYDEFVEIPVSSSDGEFIINLYPFFKPEKVAQLVKELKEYQNNAIEEELNLSEDESIDTIGYFIIKHFTNIQTTKSKKAKEINKEIKILINTQLYKEMMEYFPQESIQSIMDYAIEFDKHLLLLQEEFEKGVKELQKQDIKNKDLIFEHTKLEGGK